MAIRTPSSDKWRRTARGLIQVGLIQAVLQAYNAFAPTPLNDVQYATLTTLLTALFTLAMNWAEDETSFPAIFKAPPSTGENPVP